MATELRATDGVDATLNRVQPPPLDSMLHRLGAQPQGKKLPPGDNSMLRGRKTPDLPTQLLSL